MDQLGAIGVEGGAGTILDSLAEIGRQSAELLERLRMAAPLEGHQREPPRDHLGRTPQEAHRDCLAFSKNRPTVERGREPLRSPDVGLRRDDHERDPQSAEATAAGERSQGSATTKTTLPRDPELGQDEELLGQQLDLAPRSEGVPRNHRESTLMAEEPALWAEIQQCISRCREDKMNSPGDEQNAVLQLLADQMESITDMDWIDEVMDEMWLYVALPGSWGVSTEESVEKMWKIFHRRMREWEYRSRNPEGEEELLYRGDAPPDVMGKQTKDCHPGTGRGNPDSGTNQGGAPAHVAIQISTAGPGTAKEADAVATAGAVTYDPDNHAIATAVTAIHSPASAAAAAGVADTTAAVTTGTADAETAAAVEGDTRTADTAVFVDPAGTDTRTTTAGVAAVATAKTAGPATAMQTDTQAKYGLPPQERMETQTKGCLPPQEQYEKQTKFRLQRQTQTTPRGADKEYQPKPDLKGETREAGNARGRIPAPDAVRAGTVNAASTGDADTPTAAATAVDIDATDVTGAADSTTTTATATAAGVADTIATAPDIVEGDTMTTETGTSSAAAGVNAKTAAAAGVAPTSAGVTNITATVTTSTADAGTKTANAAAFTAAAAGVTDTTAVATPAAADSDTKAVDAAVFTAAAEGDTMTADATTVTAVTAEVMDATTTTTTAAAEGDTETSDAAVSAAAAAGATNATTTATIGTAEVATMTAATSAAATSRVTHTAATATTATITVCTHTNNTTAAAVTVIGRYTTATAAAVTCHHDTIAAATVTNGLTTNMAAAAATVTHHRSTPTAAVVIDSHAATTAIATADAEVTATATPATATAADAAAVTAAAAGDGESPSLAGASTSKIPLAKAFADPKEEPPDTAAGNGEFPNVVSTPTGGVPLCRVPADLEGEPPDAAAGDGGLHRPNSASTGGPPPASATAAEEKGLCCNVAAGDGEEPSQATRGRRDPEPPDPGAYIPMGFQRKPALPAKGDQGKLVLMVFGLLLCGCPRLQPGTWKGVLEARGNPAKGLGAQGDPVRDLEDGGGLDRGWKPEKIRPEDREVQTAPLGARRMKKVRTRAWRPGEIQPESWELEKEQTKTRGWRRTTKEPGGQGEDPMGAKRPGETQPEERGNTSRAWRPGGDQPRDWRPDKARPEPGSREWQSRESEIDENESRLSLIIFSPGCLI